MSFAVCTVAYRGREAPFCAFQNIIQVALLTHNDSGIINKTARKTSHQPTAGAGLMSLPNETIVEIIESALVDTQDELGRAKTDQLIKQLSSISRLFRQAILGTPTFWTRIDNNYFLKGGFEKRLERTKNHLLSVHIDLDSENAKLILSRLLPLQDRIGELRANLALSLFSMHGFEEANFRCLHYLNLKIDGSASSVFYDNWRYPSARIVELYGPITPPRPGSFPEITALKVFPSRYSSAPSFSNAFLRFLNATCYLNSLTFQTPLSYSYNDLWLMDDFAITELPSVSTFHLSNYEAGANSSLCGVTSLCRILKSLRMPILEEFHLCLYLTEKQALTQWLNAQAHMEEVLQSVTSFSIISRLALGSSSLTQILAPLSNIRALELRVRGVESTLAGLDLRIGLDKLMTHAPREELKVNNWSWKAESWKRTRKRMDLGISLTAREYDLFP
ncbi:hypothetical protein A7U60_g5684 [Sanghuangporus baumii]|uniref:F-box domain-containing protein n=1 Tax=Sanghuangporus baumii TaxID=108892 RepID=A0A9Q5NB83_SANBA|nr:hypothetical protein A7U60_g5684 [Sanghuangporus baumii]